MTSAPSRKLDIGEEFPRVAPDRGPCEGASQVKSVALQEYVEEGKVKASHFVTTTVPAPVEAPRGGVLLQVLALSVDPYLRGRMRTGEDYILPPFKLDAPVESGGIARVVRSDLPGLDVGDLVEGVLPWQERVALPAAAAAKLTMIPARHKSPISYYLGALGMPGFTAWWMLRTIAEPKAGESAFVSAAAGAVGSVAGQLLKQVHGCKVVGSAGSDDKAKRLVQQLGFDAAFNYKPAPASSATPVAVHIKDSLAQHCPDGLDIYFDNVGGKTLEAALGVCNRGARVVACGAISEYDHAPGTAYGIKNLSRVIGKEIKIQGGVVFTGLAQPGLKAQFDEEMGALVGSGKVKVLETVTRGLDSAPQAFVDMMAGKSVGKAVVVLE